MVWTRGARRTRGGRRTARAMARRTGWGRRASDEDSCFGNAGGGRSFVDDGGVR